MSSQHPPYIQSSATQLNNRIGVASDIVRYIDAELKYANVIWTELLILPAPDILLMHTNMLTLTQGPEVHYFE